MLIERYRHSERLLPSNADWQILARKWFDNQTSIEIFGHLSHNRMNQVPQNRQTSFGSLTEALGHRLF